MYFYGFGDRQKIGYFKSFGFICRHGFDDTRHSVIDGQYGHIRLKHADLIGMLPYPLEHFKVVSLCVHLKKNPENIHKRDYAVYRPVECPRIAVQHQSVCAPACLKCLIVGPPESPVLRVPDQIDLRIIVGHHIRTFVV